MQRSNGPLPRSVSNIIGDTRSWLWKRNRNHCSVFSQAQRHRTGAPLTKPEVLHTNEFGRAGCKLTLQAKETAFFEIANRGGTRRIAALLAHNLPRCLPIGTACYVDARSTQVSCHQKLCSVGGTTGKLHQVFGKSQRS